jgi:general secretion pathway protein C
LVAVQIDLQRLLNYLLLSLSIVGGVIAGIAAGRLISLGMGQESFSHPLSLPRQVVARQLQEDDFQVILQRNLFNSKAVGESGQIDLTTTDLVSQSISKTTDFGGNLSLVGTVVAGEESLALIKTGAKAGVFQLDEEIFPGVTVVEIGRKLVVLDDHGSRRELVLKKQKAVAAQSVHRSSQSTRQQGVVAVEEGRWQVSRSVADNARANLTSLLQTARMVPQVKNGKTTGFKLVELEKGSLLEQIGLKVGDLVVEINQVKLNSPEKALQIFQQLREANNITLGLIRNGKPKTFEYSFE